MLHWFLLYNEVNQLLFGCPVVSDSATPWTAACQAPLSGTRWAVCIHVSPFSWTSLSLPQSHSSRSSESTALSFLCYTTGSHKRCILTRSCHPPHSCVHKSFLYIWLYSCSANRFICTIFLDFIRTCSLFPILCLQAFPSSPLLTTKSSLNLWTVKFLP